MVFGTTWEMQPVRRFRVATGRYLPRERPSGGERLRPRLEDPDELFGAANPVGEMLRIGDERYRVVGVMEPRGAGSASTSTRWSTSRSRET